MLRYFTTNVVLFVRTVGKEERYTEQKVSVPIKIPTKDSLLCPARFIYERDAFETIYFAVLKLQKFAFLLRQSDTLISVQFNNLPWKITNNLPANATLVYHNLQDIADMREALDVKNLADFFLPNR